MLVFFLDGFKEVSVGTKTIFTIYRIFKEEGVERSEGESHITTKENKEADAGKIL